jgi:LuxR family maltose regulon positive regulatory protein
MTGRADDPLAHGAARAADPAPAWVLATKLVPPELPRVFVPRPDRCKHVLDGAQVTAVIAPAGFGKTVLVRERVASVTGPVAWCSLDGLDASPSSFWQHVIAALDGAVGIGDEPAAVLAERGADDPAFVAALLHALHERRTGVVLVLDDLHLVTDRLALDHLALLVDRGAPHLHLVLTARSAPALPLSRWLLEHRLVRIGDDELRFAEPDAAVLLAGLSCRPLDDDELAELVDRTEGWVAGLQLAALAHPDDPRRALGSQPSHGLAVADYLLEEVVDRLPDEQRDVALALCVLDEFDAELAAALLEREDAMRVVHDLLRGNVPASRTGGDRPTYRFHQLLRDLLRTQLTTADPARATALHRRAARLLAERGNVDAAFHHLIACGDVEPAIELVVRPALSLSDRGWGPSFRRWLARLPADLPVEEPTLLLDLAFAHFLAGDLDSASRWLDRCEARLGDADPTVAVRRLAVALAAGDLGQVEHQLANLADADPGAALGRFEMRVDTTSARGNLLLGRVADAERALDRAVAGRADEVARSVTVPAIRSRVRAAEGEAIAAAELAAEAIANASRLGVRDNPAMLETMIAATAAALAGGRTSAAAARLEELVDVVDAVDYPYARAHAAALLIEVTAQQRGRAATAGLLDELCAQAGWHGDGFAEIVGPPEARMLVAAGRLDEARTIVAQLHPGATATLLDAAILIAERRFDRALDVLDDRSGWLVADEVEALVLSAAATTGSSADAHLRAALELSTPRGLVAPFLGRGDDVERVLARLPAELVRAAGLDRRIAQPAMGRSRPAAVEPLTARERAVLDLLPTHLSNAAIGERLFVSVNTVKTNLRVLYRKLGTSSRAQTVEVARELGLLPLDADG